MFVASCAASKWHDANVLCVRDTCLSSASDTETKLGGKNAYFFCFNVFLIVPSSSLRQLQHHALPHHQPPRYSTDRSYVGTTRSKAREGKANTRSIEETAIKNGTAFEVQSARRFQRVCQQRRWFSSCGAAERRTPTTLNSPRLPPRLRTCSCPRPYRPPLPLPPPSGPRRQGHRHRRRRRQRRPRRRSGRPG